MSVASPPVAVEKFRNRIDASSRATVFEVVQGNDKGLDTLRLPETDDMRSSRRRAFARPASAAAASGQTRKDSKADSDRDIASPSLAVAPPPVQTAVRSRLIVNAISQPGSSRQCSLVLAG